MYRAPALTKLLTYAGALRLLGVEPDTEADKVKHIARINRLRCRDPYISRPKRPYEIT